MGTLRIDIVTIFPGMFAALRESIVRRAVESGLVEICVTDLRDFAGDKHRSTDDYPYGGGPGMIMRPDPFFRAVEFLQAADKRRGRVILFCPQGRTFTQEHAQRLSGCERLVMLCGHYEGIDDRVREKLADEELSLGDFILTGGEIPALAATDAIVRLLPGVLPVDSVNEETFTSGLLEYPQYTRPAEFRGMTVPEVLLSGNHERIRNWRREQSLLKTLRRRPELLNKIHLAPAERELLLKTAKLEGLELEL